MQAAYSTLLRGTAIVLFGLITRMGLLVVTEIVAARHLGPTNYGLLTWAITVVAVGSMLSCLGLPTAARRFLPIYLQDKDSARLRGTVLLVTIVTSTVGLLAMTVLYASAGTLSLRLLGDPAELPIFQALVFALPFWNIIKTAAAVSAGFKRPMIKVLLEDILVPLGMLLVVSVAATLSFGAREIALGYVAVYILSSLSGAGMIRLRSPYQHTTSVAPRFELREIIGFSWPLIFTETLGKATGIVDILIIGIVATSADVGLYRVGSDLAVTMSAVLMCFGYLYLPIASEHFARKDFIGWEALNARIARWTMLASFPIFAILFFRAGEVLQILYGAEYAAVRPVLLILAANYFLHAALGFTGSNLVVAGNTRWQLTAHVAALVIKVAGAVMLIPHYGVTGAAVATLAGTCATNAINLLVTGIKYRLHPFTLPWFKALLFMVGGAFFIDRLVAWSEFGSFGKLVLFALGIVGLMVGLARARVIFDSKDRQLFSRILRERSE